ncbi:MAG: ABC transporter ATP-binding protein [Alphaproteobacteria bacterium]|nr:ABC transporter ATP-binding protein [Alphaproteobacteria bacterium]
MPSPILEARDVNLLFHTGGETLHVLRDVCFALQPGEVASVVGPSGSGKTSLLMVLAGLEKATSGVVSIDGTDIEALDEDGLAIFRRNNFGILFQNFHLIPSMTALENVAFTLEIAHPTRPYADIRRAALDALAEVGLKERAGHFPSALSGGEQQRVGLARAIVGEPRILLADEPTGNLDQATGASVIEQMFSLARGRGTAILLITHDLRLAARADRTLSMNQGRLEEVTVNREVMA